jgi:acetyl-CoA carboxylase biotin carboxylase subunit
MDYDPMLSKLIAFAPTRELAIARMLRALDEYVIGGIRTNLGLFRRILRDEDFRAARIDTGYLDRLLAEPATGARAPSHAPVIAAALFEASRPAVTPGNGAAASNHGGWKSGTVSGWKSAARSEGLGGRS